MIQVYADGVLVYDSRLEDYGLEGLTVTSGMNVGGTAEIIMPVNHPAYDRFISYRTIVTVYRDGVLRFRGRALYVADNFYCQRTVTCEGELCLLRDAVHRPYSYAGSPAEIFHQVIEVYNSQVDDFKKFKVGSVRIMHPNNYIGLDNESAETVLDTVNKLIERCGGVITFDTLIDGNRYINWWDEIEHECLQTIEFGKNLLDFSRTGANTQALMTGLIPYGAKDETTKKRITLEPVNEGKDYIIAEDAKQLRGTIMATVTWDDITTPENLLRRAQEYLEENKVFITSLELSALDLSYLDKKLEGFALGIMVRVISRPHGIDARFRLTKLTEDFLNPSKSKITLGREIQSLTGADAAGDRSSKNDLEQFKVEMAANNTFNEERIVSSIVQKVSEKYVLKDDLTEINVKISELEQKIIELEGSI